jgi:hypothetical protein
MVRIGNGRGDAEITTGCTSEMIVGLDECDDIRLTIADEWSNLGRLSLCAYNGSLPTSDSATVKTNAHVVGHLAQQPHRTCEANVANEPNDRVLLRPFFRRSVAECDTHAPFTETAAKRTVEDNLGSSQPGYLRICDEERAILIRGRRDGLRTGLGRRVTYFYRTDSGAVGADLAPSQARGGQLVR